MTPAKPKKNVAGYVDESGRFRPIRSPQYVGSRKATPKDRRKYSKALGGDLGIEKQKAALAEKWEDPWDRDARLEREERERVEREIEGDVYGSRSERRSLMQFVRDSGGIKRQFRFGGKKAFGKRSEYDKGEIDRLSFKETGRRGLTSEKGGKTLDKMYQSAREAGYDVGSIDDLLAKVEDEAAGRGITYATMGALAYNPKKKDLRGPGVVEWNEAVLKLVPMLRKRWPDASDAALLKKAKALATTMNRGGLLKKNPDAVTTFAQLASGVLSAMQINEHMKRATKKRTTKAKGRRRNPETKAEVAARMAKVRAARKANPGPRTASSARAAVGPKQNPAICKRCGKWTAEGVYDMNGGFCNACSGKPKTRKAAARIKALTRLSKKPGSRVMTPNPRKRVTVPSKGRFYLMTVGQGDDTYGVFINDRDGDGVSKKFKTAAAAKAYATKHRLTLENPAKAPRKINPNFAPAWIKKLLAKVTPKKAAKKKNPTAAIKVNSSATADAINRLRNKGFYVISAGQKFWLHRNGKRSGLIGEATLIQRSKKGAATSVRIPFKLSDESTYPKRNPTPKKKAASGGDYYLNPFIDGVYLSHGSTLGRKFPTQAAARKYAKEKGIRLRNPKATAVKANPQMGVHSDGTVHLTRSEFAKVHRDAKFGRPSKYYPAVLLHNKVYKVTFKAAPKKKAAKNPKTTARRRTFELFNGRPATQYKALPISRLAGSGKNFDQLGDLVELHLLDGTVIKTNPAQFKLVARSGRLWVAGGPLHKGPMPTRKMNPIGKLHAVVYRTYKPHHGDPKNQHYIHEMGEWSGNKPNISLDNEGFAVITGGSYKIEDRGIVD